MKLSDYLEQLVVLARSVEESEGTHFDMRSKGGFLNNAALNLDWETLDLLTALAEKSVEWPRPEAGFSPEKIKAFREQIGDQPLSPPYTRYVDFVPLQIQKTEEALNVIELSRKIELHFDEVQGPKEES